MGTRLAAIGLGGLGNFELDVYDDIDGVEIAAGADVSASARDGFESSFDAPAYEDYETLLDRHAAELDAVNVVTPHTLHHEQAMAALDEGLDVFLEKPMVTGVDDAVELVETAAAADRILQVGYQRHFDPAFREIRRLVESRRIGDVHAVNCYLGQEWISVQEGSWRTDPKLSGGGQLYDSGSHLLDAVLWTTGTTPRSVAAVMDYQGRDVDVNSALAATLDRDGRTVTASVGVSGSGTRADPTEGLVVLGTDGRIVYDDGSLSVAEDGTVYDADLDGTDFRSLTRRKLSAFVDAVEDEREPAVSGEFGLQVTALTEAAYEAYETGETVDVQARIEEARDVVVPVENA